MDKEKQRIAIAKACGKHYNKPTEEEIASGSYYQYEPDYLSDLNAMHEVEKFIMDERSIIYFEHLNRLSCPWYATASQRAKAFLKTIGKWEE